LESDEKKMSRELKEKVSMEKEHKEREDGKKGGPKRRNHAGERGENT